MKHATPAPLSTGVALMTADLKNGLSAATLEGEHVSFAVSADTGSVSINNDSATVLLPDIVASNGVLHVIDGLLLPSSIADSVRGAV